MCIKELISRHYLKRVGQFNYVRHVDSLCLGGVYVVFPLGSACLSSNDEINGDMRKILDLYMADEEKNPDIPLPKGISIDFVAKEPILSLRPPPYEFMELYVPRKIDKKKTQPKEKIPIERQSSEASKVARKRPVEKSVVAE